MKKLKFKNSDYFLQVQLKNESSILISIFINDKAIAKYIFGTMLRKQLIQNEILSRNIHSNTKLLKYKVVGNILVLVVQPKIINNLIFQKTFKVFKAVMQSAFDLLEVNKRLAKT